MENDVENSRHLKRYNLADKSAIMRIRNNNLRNTILK